ncbi:hypothetical protein C8Q80DRAFT_947918 [Daedaleopsis nitida]|nr:hypothetical protein C8Q80DRAFT_947918 [Daedaleopsis nitida]
MSRRKPRLRSPTNSRSTLPGLLALTVVASLPSSFATPTAAKRAEPGPWCDGLGPSAFDTYPNFQLTAFNKTGDTTGVPLVLGFTGTGKDVDGATITFTSQESHPGTEAGNYSLVQGHVVPHGEQPTVNNLIGPGEPLKFLARDGLDPATYPSQQYCAVAPTSAHGGGDGHPILAVRQETELFSICEWFGQQAVVFAPESGLAYDVSTCYNVTVKLITDL